MKSHQGGGGGESLKVPHLISELSLIGHLKSETLTFRLEQMQLIYFLMC